MISIEFLLIHEDVVSVKLFPGHLLLVALSVWEFGRRLDSFLVNAVAQLLIVYQVKAVYFSLLY